MHVIDKAKIQRGPDEVPYRLGRRTFFGRLFTIGAATTTVVSAARSLFRRSKAAKAHNEHITVRIHPMAVPRTSNEISRNG